MLVEFVQQCIVFAEEADRPIFVECLQAIVPPHLQGKELNLFPKPGYEKLLKSKLKTWVRQLKILSQIRETLPDLEDPNFEIPDLKPLATWWTKEEDKSLILGVAKYGLGNYDNMKLDPEFTFCDHLSEMEKDDKKKTINN